MLLISLAWTDTDVLLCHFFFQLNLCKPDLLIHINHIDLKLNPILFTPCCSVTESCSFPAIKAVDLHGYHFCLDFVLLSDNLCFGSDVT